MRGIKCIAPIFDVSGYAEWARQYILAFIKQGIPITIGLDLVRKTGRPITFEPNHPDLGKDGDILKQYVGKDIEYDTVICWLTPEMAYEQMLHETNVKKINMTLWETDTLPDAWHSFFMFVDEIWVPGEWNKNIFIESFKKYSKEYTQFKKLLTLPIRVMPLPLNILKFENTENNNIKLFPDMPEDLFYFYFISQWNNRKNFEDLITAYYQEFNSQDPTMLVLKTYFCEGTERDKNYILRQINEVVTKINKKDNPKLGLVHGNLPSSQLLNLHRSCDCYVSPSRGEGLGLGMLEASMLGKPVICNSFGEHQSFLTEDTSFLYEYSLISVEGMNHMSPIYTSNQKWAAPNINSLASIMRKVFNTSKEALEAKANKARNEITKIYNENSVVQLMLEALT